MKPTEIKKILKALDFQPDNTFKALTQLSDPKSLMKSAGIRLMTVSMDSQDLTQTIRLLMLALHGTIQAEAGEKGRNDNPGSNC